MYKVDINRDKAEFILHMLENKEKEVVIILVTI